MTKRPVVFSDVDGTIYTKDNYVSNFNLNIIKSNNISFNIATGNPICPRMLKLAKLTNADYIIGSSGAQIYDNKRFKFVHEEHIEPSVVKQIFKLFKEEKISAAAWSSDVFYVFRMDDIEFLNQIYFRYETFDQFELVDKIDDLKQVSKIEVYFENTSNVDEIIQKLSKFNVQIIKTHMNLEILPNGASKGSAIVWMLENILKGYSKNDVMTIGDSENDFSMFDNFAFSYAMDNAKDEVKSKAKFVTSNVKAHGLGHAVLDYLAKNKFPIIK
ncbi:Cof-type HAD-IIB family hydrolase [Mycoplasmopsis hyopharyngis]|uniref:Cof-type HAD-IIB family hydrolase n=1 Tax=Mycoplasmopsis hyopharyngis TaxID=29558 RepID=UPI0038734A14